MMRTFHNSNIIFLQSITLLAMLSSVIQQIDVLLSMPRSDVLFHPAIQGPGNRDWRQRADRNGRPVRRAASRSLGSLLRTTTSYRFSELDLPYLDIYSSCLQDLLTRVHSQACRLSRVLVVDG